MNQEPKASPTILKKVWILVGCILLFLGALSWFGVNAWYAYAQNTLLWDEHKVVTVTYSAMAIPFALLVWYGIKTINKIPESASLEKRKMAMLNLVLQPLGWSFLFLAYTLSEMREQWYVAREVYFSIATATSAMMFFTFLVQLKMTREKVHIISVIAWLLMFCLFLHRFVWSSATKGLFG